MTSDFLTDRTFEWNLIDEGPDGSAQFLVTTQITGQTLGDLPQTAKTAIYRLICFHLIGRLNVKSLLVAGEWLADLYARQLKEPQFDKKIPETLLFPEPTSKREVLFTTKRIGQHGKPGDRRAGRPEGHLKPIY